MEVTDRCIGEYSYTTGGEVTGVSVDTMESNHLVSSLRCLLENGLDPNLCVGDEENPFFLLMWVDAPLTAPEAMLLLLEHGLDPNLTTEGETVSSLISFDLYNDDFLGENNTRNLFWCWVLLIMHGGDPRHRIEMCGIHTTDELKNFAAYEFTFSPPCSSIRNAKTGEETARII